MKESITPQDVIDILNRAIKADQAAMTKLMSKRFYCNEELANDPTIQVRQEKSFGVPGGEGVVFTISANGLLNSLWGIDENGWGPIAAIFEIACPNTQARQGKVAPCDATDKDFEGLGITNPCPKCGCMLQLGKLLSFQLVTEEMKAPYIKKDK